MYTGTLIEQLFASVERVEKQNREQVEPVELERWFATAHQQVAPPEPNLLGVA